MDDDPEDMRTFDLNALRELAGADFFDIIMERSPDVVIWRIAKAADHYNRARRLGGVDEEMAAIRLIAAEEELVVATFKWLECNPGDYPDAALMLRRFKDHRVKLSFYPVLCQFIWALEGMADGVAPDGLNAHISWKPELVADGGKVQVRLCDDDGHEIIRQNPLAIGLNRNDLTPEEIIASLLERMRANLLEQCGTDLKTFVLERAGFRDRLLYAWDEAPSFSMAETLEDLLEVFDVTLQRLLRTLAVLVSDPPPARNWGLVAQFLALYHHVLAECGIGKVPPTKIFRPPEGRYEEVEFIAR